MCINSGLYFGIFAAIINFGLWNAVLHAQTCMYLRGKLYISNALYYKIREGKFI